MKHVPLGAQFIRKHAGLLSHSIPTEVPKQSRNRLFSPRIKKAIRIDQGTAMQGEQTTSISPLVRRSSYLGIALLAAFNVAVLAFSRADLLTYSLPMFLLHGVLLLAVFVSARRILGRMSRPNDALLRIHYLFEGLFFLHIAWLNLRLLNHLSMMLPFPYADGLLASWDRALHLDWAAYFNAVVSRPLLYEVLDVSYTSLTLLSMVVLITLILFGSISRAREFIETFLLTAVICIVIGAAFPAKAAVVTLIPDLSTLAHLRQLPGAYHIPYMDILRDPSASVLLDPAQLPGLATFPSFHTASGILIIYACRKSWLSVPSWIYSIVMIAATPVHGGHYIVDLLAGALAALLAIKVVKHMNEKNRDFAPPRGATTCAAI
jgi:hypothetical protein